MASLREVRIRKLLSRRALADRSGISVRTIAAVENGETTPQLRTARQLAEALDVVPKSVDELRATIQARIEGIRASGRVNDR